MVTVASVPFMVLLFILTAIKAVSVGPAVLSSTEENNDASTFDRDGNQASLRWNWLLLHVTVAVCYWLHNTLDNIDGILVR